jgi:hypothetical protein
LVDLQKSGKVWTTAREVELLLDKGPHLLVLFVILRHPLAKQSQRAAFASLNLSLGRLVKLLLSGRKSGGSLVGV